MKVIIIGGVAGGATTAARLRRMNESAEIIIFEKTNFVSYATCGLPYYVGNTIVEDKALTLQTPASFKKRFNIDVHVNHEVVDIDTQKKLIKVVNLNTNETIEESYDYLVLAPGAKPIVPAFCKGKKNIYTVKTVEETVALKEEIKKGNVSSATIIGGGFIGVEMAENLANIGVQTTLVQLDDHLLPNIDKDMAAFVHAKCRTKFNLLLNSEVVNVEESNEGLVATTKDGKTITSDIIICAIGVTPNNDLATKAGLELGVKGSINVNEHMQTSAKDVYACGDAVMVKHSVSGKDSLISLAGPANKQARVLANSISGIEDSYFGAQGTSVIKVFDYTVASTGLTEAACKKLGLNYEKIITAPMSHAGYYPGAKPLIIKVMFDKETQLIYGAQIVGSDGVDKRIDVLATAIKFGVKAPLLKDLDLAYAPPFSAAKDPINLVGCIAHNLVKGVVKQFYYEDIEELRKQDVILLDTRTVPEYELAHAEGFINIPLDELRQRLNELDLTKKIYVMCHSGFRSYVACKILNGYGADAYNFACGHLYYSTVHNDK